MIFNFIFSLALCAAGGTSDIGTGGAHWSEHFDAREFQVFRPSEFFDEFHSAHYAEMKDLNPKNSDQMRRLMNYLQNNGIPIGIGTNANNHTIFELYLPLVSRPDGLMGPTIGVNENSRVGNLYFLDHDSVHHVVGIPGVRLDDLQNPIETRKKLIEIFLLKEQVATTHSMLDYIRAYWNWRDKERHGRERPDFVELNQGFFSFGKMPREEAVNMIGDFVFGRSLSYAKKIAKTADPAWTIRARTAGVPLASPNLHPYIGLKAEAWLLKFLLPVLEPILARKREVGYNGFISYSTAMADFMLQHWYVEWSDRFEVGIPLDQLKQRALDHLEAFKKEELVGDEKAVSNEEFEKKFLNHEISFFARRLAEFREMGRLNRLQSYDSEVDGEALLLYEKAASLHDRLKLMEEVNQPELQALRAELSELMNEAEKNLSLRLYLPTHERQPYIQYDNYWTALTGLLIPRYGHNSGALGTTDLKNFISFKRSTETSFVAKAKWNFLEVLHRTQIGRPEVWKIQQDLAADYEKAQESKREFQFSSDASLSGSVYLSKLSDLSRSIGFQVERVVIPQLLENRELSIENKKALIAALREFSLSISGTTSSMDLNYREAFLTTELKSGRAFQFREREGRFNVFVERALSSVWKIVKLHQSRAKSSRILKEGALLIELMKQNADLQTPLPGSLKENLQQIYPIKKFRWQAIGELTKSLLGNSSEPMLDLINQSVRPFRFMRKNSQASAKFVGWKPEAISEASHYILNLSHDQGLLEVHLAYQTFEALGVEKIYVLTTKKAWGKFPKGKIPGEEVVYIEDEKPLDELVKRILASTNKKVGILFCPEGQLPSMLASTPITAKPGAFVFARKLAVALASSQSLYMINGTFNAHQHFSSVQPADLELNLRKPVRVPGNRLTRSDTWISQQRLIFEDLANQGRVLDSIDLIHPRIASQTNFPVCGPLRAYLPINEWFGGNIFVSCARRLRALGQIKLE